MKGHHLIACRSSLTHAVLIGQHPLQSIHLLPGRRNPVGMQALLYANLLFPKKVGFVQGVESLRIAAYRTQFGEDTDGQGASRVRH